MRRLVPSGALVLAALGCGRGPDAGTPDQAGVPEPPSAPPVVGGGGLLQPPGARPPAATWKDESAELYDAARLPRFDLDLPAASVASLAADPLEYVRGTLRYGDEVVRDVGVRLKGEWTFRPLDAKAAFKLKFDEFVPGQRFHGLSRMNLNNAIEDASFISERIAYTAFRAAGVPAPRCNNATVHVNGVPYGLYVNVETEDEVFIARWFFASKGNIYEEGGVDLVPGAETTFELETNETANDRSDLAALIAAIAAARDDTLLADLAPVLDTAELLRFSALEGMVNQWDGVSYNVHGSNNYRLYHDPAKNKFSYIPWGMDMAFKPVAERILIPMLEPNGLLLRRCFAGAACRAAYFETVRAMTALFESLDLPALAVRFHAQVQAAALADTRKEFGNETFESTSEQVISFLASRPASVRAEIP